MQPARGRRIHWERERELCRGRNLQRAGASVYIYKRQELITGRSRRISDFLRERAESLMVIPSEEISRGEREGNVL